MHVRMTPTTALTLALAASAAGCKGKSETNANAAAPPPVAAAAAKPAAPPAPLPAGTHFDVAIAMPRSTRTFDVPGARVEQAEPGKDVTWFKGTLGDDRDTRSDAEQKLADGWVFRYGDNGSPTQFAVYRTIAGVAFLCQEDGGLDDDEHDRGRASCLAARAVGEELVVPFAFAADHTRIHIDDDDLAVDLAKDDDPKNIDEQTHLDDDGLKVLRRREIAGGFGVAYKHDYPGGDRHALYEAAVRSVIGQRGIMCTTFGGAPSADAAVRVFDRCMTLRAP